MMSKNTETIRRQLHEFQEKQMEKFQRLHLENKERALRQIQEMGSPRSAVLDNVSANLNSSATNSSLQDSPATAHMQRCFNDTANDSPVVAQAKIDNLKTAMKSKPQVSNTDNEIQKENKSAIVKRPFLRKKSGLLRYQSSGASRSPRKHESPSQNDIPMRRVEFSPPRKNKVQIHEPRNASKVNECQNSKFDRNTPKDRVKISPSKSNVKRTQRSQTVSKALNFDKTPEDKNTFKHPLGEREAKYTKEDDIRKTPCKAVSVQKEFCEETPNTKKDRRELLQYEILETCAQNGSLDSNSSLVQDIFEEETLKVFKGNEESHKKKNDLPPFMQKSSFEQNDMDIPQIHRQKDYLKEKLLQIMEKKKEVKDFCSEIELREASIAKEISESNMNYRVAPVSIRDDPTKTDSTESVDFATRRNEVRSSDRFCDVPITHAKNQRNTDTVVSDPEESSSILPRLDKIKEIELKLKKEIKEFEAARKDVEREKKEYEETMIKLKRECQKLQKSSEEEKQKYQTMMEQERKQMRQEKESYARMQKMLQSDRPNRKWKDESNLLRKEKEQLSVELKRLRIRYNNETSRLKNLLADSEKKNDTLRMENMNLEEISQDLIKRVRENKKSSLDFLSVATNMAISVRETSKFKGCSNYSSNDDLSSNSEEVEEKIKGKLTKPKSLGITNFSKSKVRFDPNPCILNTVNYDDEEDLSQADAVNYDVDEEDLSKADKVDYDVDEEDLSKAVEKCLRTDFTAALSLADVPRLNSETEVPYSDGIQEILHQDGNKIVIYSNGDVKIHHPDGKEIHKDSTGFVRTQYPDNLIEIIWADGQTQRYFPDGAKEVIFTNGLIKRTFCDGSEKIFTKHGAEIVNKDGAMTITYKNGEKETRTEDYKKKEFLSGRVQIFFKNGDYESRHPNGRVRRVDAGGRVIFDTGLC